MKQFSSIILIAIIFIFLISIAFVQAGRRDQKALEARLAYLKDIAEISWVIFDKNNVYLGFNKIPDDMGTIVRGAALQGNKAYGFGVHVWAMDANKGDWKTAPHYYTATARHGRVAKSSCR